MKTKEVAVKLTDMTPRPTIPVRGDSLFLTEQQFESFLDQGGIIRNELVYRVHLGQFDKPASTQPLIAGRESALYRFG